MRTFGRDADIEFGISMAEPENHPLDYALNLRPRGGGATSSAGRPYPKAETSPCGSTLTTSMSCTTTKAGSSVPTGNTIHLSPHFRRCRRCSARQKGFESNSPHALFIMGSMLSRVLRFGSRKPCDRHPFPEKTEKISSPAFTTFGKPIPTGLKLLKTRLNLRFPASGNWIFRRSRREHLAMTWRDKSFAQPLYTHQLSEGMLSFLWIVTLLQSPGLTALTLIDEPEVSLHPELLSLLAGLLREASSRRSQIFVATHSDRLIGFLKPEEVVVMDAADDGSSTLTWADRMNLDHCLENYSLDDLWRNGRLGGRA